MKDAVVVTSTATGGVAGAKTGAEIGAAAGTMCAPGVGTAVGATVGAVVGAAAGYATGRYLADQIEDNDSILHTAVCDAENPANRVPLDKWDLYGNDLLTLVYKRRPDTDSGVFGQPRANPCPPTSSICEPLTPKSTEPPIGKTNKKRTWDKLDLMKLLRSISRGETPELEIIESNDYDNTPEN